MNRLRLLAVFRRAAARTVFTVAIGANIQPLVADELNVWPFWVGQTTDSNPEQIESWSAVGPLVFKRTVPPERPADKPAQAGGFRPFYVWKRDDQGALREAYGLYPFLTYRAGMVGAQRWSFLNLINYSVVPPSPGEAAARNAAPDKAFDVWPFYFSRTTGNPDLDYKALFPIGGEVKQRFGQDRWSWVLFPLYGKFEKKGVTTTTVPWPFIKIVRGDGNVGNELWPLYGEHQKAGVYHERFILWPFFYDNKAALWKEQPDEKFGVLPFYALDRSEGYVSETWLWPFFGYVDRTIPYRYHARHYFWPLFVQGQGDNRRVNRWGPFYTHSVIKGVDKRWVLWPLWRRLQNREGALDQTKTQFLYFLYNATTQRSVTNPAAEPARKVYVWPLASVWNNGAGRKQVQVLSPMDVFFTQNDPVRLAWTPLFALYRYDRKPDGEVRHSVLWDGITYRAQPSRGLTSFHLGPLFSVENRPSERRIALISGLFGFKRGPAEQGWRLFFGEFKRFWTSGAAAVTSP